MFETCYVTSSEKKNTSNQCLLQQLQTYATINQTLHLICALCLLFHNTCVAHDSQATPITESCETAIQI